MRRKQEKRKGGRSLKKRIRNDERERERERREKRERERERERRERERERREREREREGGRKKTNTQAYNKLNKYVGVLLLYVGVLYSQDPFSFLSVAVRFFRLEVIRTFNV